PAKAAAPGDVVINEFVSEPNPEWLELYNTTNSPVSLDGWRIRDAADNTFATLDVSDTISGKSFLVVEDNTTLNNGGPESSELLDDSGVVIDTISYPGGVDTPESGQSAGRAGDGADDWMIFNNPTKGTTNNLARV